MRGSQADEHATEMLETMGRRGFAFAWQILRNHDDALDAVQAAMVAVWRNRSRLRFGPEARGWFYRVLRNRCIDTLRSRRVRRTAALEADPPERSVSDPARDAAQRERVQRLRRVLNEMTDEMREIILLRDFHDLSYAEIADVLGIPGGTVMSRLHRARAVLRERMLAEE